MKAERDLPVWRSLLYVPVNVEKFVRDLTCPTAWPPPAGPGLPMR